MGWDTEATLFLNGLTGSSTFIDSLIVFLASYLPWLLIVAFLALLYSSAETKKGEIYVFGVTMISAAIARFGLVEIIRLFFHRPRPFLALPQIHALFKDTEWSFPSGHASFFFAMAMAIYLYNKKWGVWFFIATIIVTVSRVAAGVHYPTDILAGLVVGVCAALAARYIAEKFKLKEMIHV